jgi:imidazolonepropionase-like amidohydrolase
MDLVIHGGTILLPEAKIIENGSVIVENGKIKEIVANYTPREEETIIDAVGLFITPGLVDPHTHAGVWGEALGPPGFDGNEATDPVTPFLRIIDAIYHEDVGFEDALRGGVTTVGVTMGSANIIGGEAAVLKTKPGILFEKLIKEPVGLKMALGENPKRFYGADKKTPSTRMGNAYLMRKALIDAQNYISKWEAYEKDEKKDTKAPPDRDLGMEALARVIRKEVPAKIHAHRADDIITAVRIAEEFDINYTLDHCTEGHLIVDFLVEKKATCIVGPIMISRIKVEVKNLDPKTVGVLYNAGVKVSITTDHPFIPIHHFLKQVEEAVDYGLPLEGALDVITINAAQALGVDDRLGAIKEGYDADIILLTKPPGVPGCRVMKTIIDGELVWEK